MGPNPVLNEDSFKVEKCAKFRLLSLFCFFSVRSSKSAAVKSTAERLELFSWKYVLFYAMLLSLVRLGMGYDSPAYSKRVTHSDTFRFAVKVSRWRFCR